MNVYLIQNKVNGAVYIGKANDPRRRAIEHMRSSSNAHLHNAVRVYGRDAFEFSVLETFDTEQEAYEQEAWWIEYLRSVGAVLYNRAVGGKGGQTGRVHTEDARAKISAAGRGRKPSAQARLNMSKAQSRKILSDEHKAKISAAHLGRPGTNTGKRYTPEHRAKISAAHKGKIVSAETRAKISAAGMGRIPTPTARAHMSAAGTGRVATPETRAKLSRAWEKRRLTIATPISIETA